MGKENNITTELINHVPKESRQGEWESPKLSLHAAISSKPYEATRWCIISKEQMLDTNVPVARENKVQIQQSTPIHIKVILFHLQCPHQLQAIQLVKFTNIAISFIHCQRGKARRWQQPCNVALRHTCTVQLRTKIGNKILLLPTNPIKHLSNRPLLISFFHRQRPQMAAKNTTTLVPFSLTLNPRFD